MISFVTKNLLTVLFFTLFFAISLNAQSTSSDFPTPVTSNEIKGKIAARDIGDARPTRYFYTFTGTQGDLNITIESENLNGDVDIFTLNGLRPLAKISLFDYGFKIVTTGNVFLRKREALLLRIEAKSKGESSGTFRIQFSGGFEAMADAGEKKIEEPKVAKTTRAEGTFRVNSAGARLEEPTPPVKEKPAPKTETASTTNNTNAAKTKPAVTPKSTTPKPNTTTTTKTTTTNTTETVTNTAVKKETPAARRKRLAEERAEAERKRKEAAAAEIKRKQDEKKAAAEERNNSVAKNESSKTINKTDATNKTNSNPATVKTKEPAPDPMASISLIVETKDGGRIERRMNEVRRVNVEKGFLVIIFMDGKTERISMTNVLKMSIEPQ